MGKCSCLIIKDVNNKYDTEQALRNVVSYVVRNKDDEGYIRYWNAYGANNRSIEKTIRDFKAVQNCYGKADKKRIRHIIVSFPKTVDDANVAKMVAENVASYLFKGYQVVYGVHEKEGNLHIHFAFNPVSFKTGKKWHKSKKEFLEWKCEILDLVNSCLEENGYVSCKL